MTTRKRVTPSLDQVPQYSREALLTIEEVAQALRCSVRMVERADLPTIYIGRGKLRRYCWGSVFDTLLERSA